MACVAIFERPSVARRLGLELEVSCSPKARTPAASRMPRPASRALARFADGLEGQGEPSPCCDWPQSRDMVSERTKSDLLSPASPPVCQPLHLHIPAPVLAVGATNIDTWQSVDGCFCDQGALPGGHGSAEPTVPCHSSLFFTVPSILYACQDSALLAV
jgi:hypothetical protein